MHMMIPDESTIKVRVRILLPTPLDERIKLRRKIWKVITTVLLTPSLCQQCHFKNNNQKKNNAN